MFFECRQSASEVSAVGAEFLQFLVNGGHIIARYNHEPIV